MAKKFNQKKANEETKSSSVVIVNNPYNNEQKPKEPDGYTLSLMIALVSVIVLL